MFAVEDEYQILLPADAPSLLWIRVGDRCFYDDENGVLRSETDMHRVTVPMDVLDAAGEYTVCERQIPHRKPYNSKPGPIEETTYRFCPVPRTGEIRAYMIADTHDRVKEAIRAVKAFGKVDFVIFNGDIADDNDDHAGLMRIFEIADGVAGGEIPLLFARGNHDTRGRFAEKLTQYTPNAGGRSYYWFRLGRVRGLVLDCGEDKVDEHPEYGGTICCHDFRLRETAFLERLGETDVFAGEKDGERIVIAHHPFTHVVKPPFDIEQPLYRRWASLLSEIVHPDVLLTGHLHNMWICMPGGKKDDLGQPCPVVTGSKVGRGYFAGTGVTFREDGVYISFTDSDGKLLGEHLLPK